MKCLIYRCSKKAEMYLYLPWQEDEQSQLDDLPEGLKQLVGQLKNVMELELGPDRKLARADVSEVISALEKQGYYLQMPPNELIRNDQTMLSDKSDGF